MWDLSCSKRVRRKRRKEGLEEKVEEKKRGKGEEILKARRAGTEASRLGWVREGRGGVSGRRFRMRGVGKGRKR